MTSNNFKIIQRMPLQEGRDNPLVVGYGAELQQTLNTFRWPKQYQVQLFLALEDMSREEYKLWVKKWKLLYKQVSKLSRLLKQYRKTTVVHTKRGNKTTGLSDEQIANLRYVDVSNLAEVSQLLLKTREMSKIVAERSYLKEKTAK